MQLNVVERKARKIQLGAWPQGLELTVNVAAIVLKQQTIPLLQRVVVEVQAGVMGKMRRAQQLATGVVGPAVQGADDVAASTAWGLVLQIAPAFEHDGLAVATHVGHQLDALGRVHQSAAPLLLRQGQVVARVGHTQAVAHITGAALK